MLTSDELEKIRLLQNEKESIRKQIRFLLIMRSIMTVFAILFLRNAYLANINKIPDYQVFIALLLLIISASLSRVGSRYGGRGIVKLTSLIKRVRSIDAEIVRIKEFATL